LGGDIADFPLLVKYIDAGDKLSIQVHPAKTEKWYVVDCDEDSWLIYGQEGDYTEADLRAALDCGKLEDKLTKVHIKPGECYFIPTGLTHAIGGGILIAEIQENSNITYRVYDYDRRQDDGSLRELHTDRAFTVMKKFTEDEIQKLRFSVPCHAPVMMKNYSGTSGLLASCDKFTTRRFDFSGELTLTADEHFLHIMCVDGAGTLSGEPIKAGDSYFVPAGTGEVTLRSDSRLTILESFCL
ncbi:MAG: class I mannose-6-phosphate isomerase, partial [Eubacteriales bacterium]